MVAGALQFVAVGVDPNAAAQAQCAESDKLTALDATPSDWFGESVSVDGRTTLVGAYGNGCCGAAYVFRLDETGWIQEQKLKASDQDGYDVFGWAVSLSGDTGLVGALWDDCADGGSNCGAVYVYRYNGDAWVQQQKLTASDASPNDDFGYYVSLNDDTAVIGARLDDWGGGVDRGSAYVFRYSGDDWIEEQRLSALDGRAGDWFGDSVSVSGDTAVVGAYGDDCESEGFDCGSAYVFHYNGAEWVQEQKLRASDGSPNDWFGDSVSISGNAVVVGARLDECAAGGNNCGSAYVFRFNGNAWVEEQKFTASDAAPDDHFGRSVSISGNAAVVGVRSDDCADGADCGSAYVFRFDGATWVEERKLTAADAAPDDLFGHSVSVSAEIAVVTAVLDDCDGGGSNCGSAHVFDLRCVNCDSLRRFRVNCNRGRLSASVKSSLPEGTQLTLDNNGDRRNVVTINARGRAKGKWTEQAGVHTVSVVECPERFGQTDCG